MTQEHDFTTLNSQIDPQSQKLGHVMIIQTVSKQKGIKSRLLFESVNTVNKYDRLYLGDSCASCLTCQRVSFGRERRRRPSTSRRWVRCSRRLMSCASIRSKEPPSTMTSQLHLHQAAFTLTRVRVRVFMHVRVIVNTSLRCIPLGAVYINASSIRLWFALSLSLSLGRVTRTKPHPRVDAMPVYP